MLILCHLENRVIDVSAITSLSVMTVERSLDHGRTYTNYEILATCGSEKEVIIYSVPAEESNQETVRRVFRNVVALMSGNYITTGEHNVYSAKTDLVNIALYDQKSGISKIEPYFPQ